MATTDPSAFLWQAQFARELQDRIFPSSRPSIPNLDYYCDSRRGQGPNGDYLDNFEVDGGHLCLAIGEVSSTGLHSALLAASLHSIVRALRLSRTGNLSTFVASVDELFGEVCPKDSHASLFVGEYDPVSSRLHYVNAGQEAPFVLRHNGRRHRIIRLEASEPFAAFLRLDFRFTECSRIVHV